MLGVRTLNFLREHLLRMVSLLLHFFRVTTCGASFRYLWLAMWLRRWRRAYLVTVSAVFPAGTQFGKRPRVELLIQSEDTTGRRMLSWNGERRRYGTARTRRTAAERVVLGRRDVHHWSCRCVATRIPNSHVLTPF